MCPDHNVRAALGRTKQRLKWKCRKKPHVFQPIKAQGKVCFLSKAFAYIEKAGGGGDGGNFSFFKCLLKNTLLLYSVRN